MDYMTLFWVFVFYLFILLTGIWASKKGKSKSGGDGKIHNMILGGRNMGFFVGALTMTATWVGGGYINGTAESVYANGLVWTQAPWGYSISLIIGGLFFAKTMREKNYTTLLDPFEQRYGHKVSALLFIPALIGDVFWSSAILAALGHTFSTLLGIDFTLAVVISSSIAIAYTFVGGLWSVAYTDVIQLIFIFLGLGIAVPYIVSHGGGLSSVIQNYQNHFGAEAGLIPEGKFFLSLFSLSESENIWGKQIWHWLDLALLLVFGGIPWGVYFQRVLACPTPELARKLSFLAGIACFLMAIPAILIGAAALNVDWTLVADGTKPEAAMILPYALKYLTPKWVSILGLSAIAAAVMSSIDSSILSSASMFTWNIFRKFSKNPSERQMLIVTKASILVVGLLGTLLALRVQSVYALWFLCADLVYVILFPQLVMVLFYKKSHSVGALAGLFVGLVLRLGGGEPSLGVPAFIAYPMNYEDLGLMFPFRTFSMLSSLVVIMLVSRFYPYENSLDKA